MTQAAQLMATAGIGAGLFLQATGRYEALHVLPSSIMAALAATALLYRLYGFCRSMQGRARSLAVAIAVSALACLALARPYVLHFTELMESAADYHPLRCLSSAGRETSSPERAGCVPVGADQAQAVEYIRSRTDPDEPIYVGNLRHRPDRGQRSGVLLSGGSALPHPLLRVAPGDMPPRSRCSGKSCKTWFPGTSAGS